MFSVLTTIDQKNKNEKLNNSQVLTPDYKVQGKKGEEKAVFVC